MTATVKVDSGGCHVNGGRGGGHFRRGQPTRQHPFPPGTLSPTAAKVLATSVPDETAAVLAAAVAMSASLPSGCSGGGGGGGGGGMGCGGLA